VVGGKQQHKRIKKSKGGVSMACRLRFNGLTIYVMWNLQKEHNQEFF
jgi:hypothetical protein